MCTRVNSTNFVILSSTTRARKDRERERREDERERERSCTTVLLEILCGAPNACCTENALKPGHECCKQGEGMDK